MPKDFQCNFLRHKRNKLALNSFPAGKLLTHDFVGAIVFISVNSEVTCYSTDVNEEGNNPHFLRIKEYLVECMVPEYIHHIKYVLCIIEYHSWALCKVDENKFNLIEEYVCADYDPHNCFLTSEVNRQQFFSLSRVRPN